ncbi:MAG: TonB family protein [Gemmatimonadetes bacterium]|nr:TonB family protein [Gemmatimonadota bacterium]
MSLAGSIPANARITVDGNSVRSTRVKLPAGRHRLQIVAEGFRPHQATVAIVANQTYVHNVALASGESEPEEPAAPSGVNCEATSSVANPNRACYDTRPNPRGILQIAMPEACAGNATAATVLVRVSAAGEVVGTPIATSPGSCRAFGAAAAAYAEQLTFQPATKNGQAVTVWVTIPIRPTPRP